MELTMENTSRKPNVKSKEKSPFAGIQKRVRRIFRYETPDPKSTVLHTGLRTSLPVAEQVRRLVAQEVSRVAEASGHETWEESDDFDVVEDGFPRSQHEMLVDDDGHRPVGDFIEETILPGERRSDDPASDSDLDPPSDPGKPGSDNPDPGTVKE